MNIEPERSKLVFCRRLFFQRAERAKLSSGPWDGRLTLPSRSVPPTVHDAFSSSLAGEESSLGLFWHVGLFG